MSVEKEDENIGVFMKKNMYPKNTPFLRDKNNQISQKIGSKFSSEVLPDPLNDPLVELKNVFFIKKQKKTCFKTLF